MSDINELLSTDLLYWYDKNHRKLPWRENATAYYVWLSEIMSQQTRIETVVAYYKRFLVAFPDIFTLAAASEGKVFKMWEGLGYYRRAKNLHRTAHIIVEEYGGQFPETALELKKLPGIGDYTAAAIASIVSGERIPAIDGNLLRVFARLSAYPESILKAKARREAYDFFMAYMPMDRAGDFNQALMELGATICVPKGAIRCEECPCQDYCAAYRTHRQAFLPYRPVARERSIEDKTVLLLRHDEEVIIRQRPKYGLLAGLYEFPCLEGAFDSALVLSFLEEHDYHVETITELASQKHLFSHIEWRMSGFELMMTDATWYRLSHREDLVVVNDNDLVERYTIPTAFRFYRDYVLLRDE